MTGRYQQRFGHENQPENDNTNPRLGLPLQELLLPQMLKPAGYVCGLIGKWHLGTAPNMRPIQRGFDEFFGFLSGASQYYNANVIRNSTPLIERSYLTDAFTREGVSFINRHATEPFFLLLSYNAPHVPNDIPPQLYMDQVANITDPARQIYAAMITALDVGVGQVLQTLQAQNLLNNTLILFLSDNGAPQATYTRNYPLRGYKYSMWEGGIRVPFAVQWTGQLPAGLPYAQPVSALDIVPTIAAVAGVSLPPDRIYDGLNVVPYLMGGQVAPLRTLFWRWFGLGATGPPASQSRATIYAVRSDSLKLVKHGGSPSVYNVSADITESNDLARLQPEKLASLSQLYSQWEAEMIAPLWQQQDSGLTRMVLAGDWNGYNKDDSSAPWSLTRVTAPGAPRTPIRVAAAGGDTTPGLHSFVLVGGGSYSSQWGGATINIDGTTSVPFFSGGTLGPTNTISFDEGFYYSFRTLDWRNTNSTLAVMKTSAPPVSVNVASQTPIAPTSDDSVVISIVTSQPKSTEERVYLRWSTDTDVTSHMVEAVGSGLNYSAVIPAQPAGTSVQYCITTSTVDLSQLVTSGSIDVLVIAMSSSTHFVVAPGATATPTPTPTGTPTSTPSPTASPPPSPTAMPTDTPTATPTATPTSPDSPTPSPTVTVTPSATATPTQTPTATSTGATQVTVQTNPAGLTFSVDGTSYSCTQTFSWTLGSSHTIGTTSPQNGASGVRYVWSRWSDNGTISHTVAPTVNKTYTATFTTQYYLTMAHGTWGSVSPTSGWKNNGATVSISATPTNNTQVNYSFSGWTGTGTGSYSGTNNPASITMNGPVTENAFFTQNNVQVTVQTNLAGRTFSVDGTSYSSAQAFSWQPGSTHTIATTSPQNGATGVRHVWTNWSDGGAISHTVAPTTNKTYTANFNTQYFLTMSHNTGGSVTPASAWKISGATISISATPSANYHFTNWNGSGTGSYSGTNNPASITMDGPITEAAAFTHN